MKKFFHTYWAVIVMIVGLFLPQIAFAAETSSADDMKTTINEVITLANTGVGVLQFFLWPLLAFAGDLLTNNFIFGAGMEDKLLAIWQDVRNVVNLLFVVVLLVIAFANILGLGQENKYAIKKMLPRFVISLLLVNFSFFAIKVLVDVSNVMTTAFIGIAGTQVIKTDTVWKEIKDSDTYYLNLYSNGEYAGPAPVTGEEIKNKVGSDTQYKGFNLTRIEFQAKVCNPKGKLRDDVLNTALYCEFDSDKKSTGGLSSLGKTLLKDFNVKNVTLLMASNLMNLNQVNVLTEVDTAPTSTDTTDTIKWLLKTISNLAVRTIVSIILLFVFGTAIIALIAILLVRVVVIWNILVLSPLLALKQFIPESINGSFDLQKIVIKHITAPIIIAATMGIGFVMLKGLSNSYMINAETIFDDPSGALSDLRDLAIVAGAVAVVWTGVGAAAKDTFAESIVKTTQDAVKGIGSFAGKAVTYYAPIIPSGVKGQPGTSLAAAFGGIKGVEGQIKSAINKQASDISIGMAKPLLGALNLPVSYLPEAIMEMKNYLATNTSPGVSDAAPRIQKLVGESTHGELNTEEVRGMLHQLFNSSDFKSRYNIEDAKLEKLNTGKMSVEDFLKDLPTDAKNDLFENKSIEDFRKKYKEQHPHVQENPTTAASKAADTTVAATPIAAVTAALVADNATADIVAAAAKEQFKANPENKKAKALSEITNNEYEELLKVKSTQTRQEILEEVVGDDGMLKKEMLIDLTAAAEAVQTTNLATFKKLLEDGKITTQQAWRIVSQSGLDDAKKKPLTEAIKAQETAASVPPAAGQPASGQPPPPGGAAPGTPPPTPPPATP